jgi:hypothetical protein
MKVIDSASLEVSGMKSLAALVLLLVLSACARADAEPPLESEGDTTLVISTDRDLRLLAAELLPGLSSRSGLELREPVRVERRTRGELEAYLRVKLDEELPADEADRLARSYHLLGLAPADLDLRSLLLAVYREQVAGFYDPDSTALFVLDDQGPDALRPLLLHELVHAVQDQSADLDALTAKELGNDRRKAAQSAIEGHATLVMMEHVLGERRGQEIDLAEIPDMADQLRPALDALQAQFPALASAPRIVQEALLFPYLEGASFMLAFWRTGARRGAAFEGSIPRSTEQVMEPARAFGEEPDEPTPIELVMASGTALYEDDLGRAEADVLLRELTGREDLAAWGWDGDRYALVAVGDLAAGDSAAEQTGLVWGTVWDDAVSRDRFIAALRPALGRLPLAATLESIQVGTRAGALLRVGVDGPVEVAIASGEG